MASTRKVIITCAVTGSVHTPTMTPHLPITPEQIARESIDAAEAGAAIIHLHARDPKDGRPTPNPDVFMQFLPRIKQSCDAVVKITTGGSLGMTIEDRLAAPLRASPCPKGERRPRWRCRARRSSSFTRPISMIHDVKQPCLEALDIIGGYS